MSQKYLLTQTKFNLRTDSYPEIVGTPWPFQGYEKGAGGAFQLLCEHSYDQSFNLVLVHYVGGNLRASRMLSPDLGMRSHFENGIIG